MGQGYKEAEGDEGAEGAQGSKGKVHEKKSKKKLTSVSFIYVCVGENVELLVFFPFFLHLPIISTFINIYKYLC